MLSESGAAYSSAVIRKIRDSTSTAVGATKVPDRGRGPPEELARAADDRLRKLVAIPFERREYDAGNRVEHRVVPATPARESHRPETALQHGYLSIELPASPVRD